MESPLIQDAVSYSFIVAILVYNALEHHLADLDEFKGSIINFLEENEGAGS